MTKYIENVNMYLSVKKIKQTYISLKTGIDTKKLSLILTGIQDVTSSDMEKISAALGKKTEFFLSDAFHVPEMTENLSEKIAFYAGEAAPQQEKIAGQLLELMENIDEVMSAKQRFLNLSEE